MSRINDAIKELEAVGFQIVPAGTDLAEGFYNTYETWQYRSGVLVNHDVTRNRIVGQGKDWLLGVISNDGSAAQALYVGLLANDRTVDGTETAASITAPAGGGDIEEYAATVWTGSTRPLWNTDAVSGSGDGAYTVDNDTNKASYTVDTGQSATVYGAFLGSSSTIQGVAGIVFSIAKFSASKALAAADVLQVKYTVQYGTGA